MAPPLTSAADTSSAPSLGSRVLIGAQKTMTGFLNTCSLRGVGMIVLQGLRVATVITLLTACAACWILIIKIDKTKAFFVFECSSLFFTSVFSSLLIVSELAFTDFLKIYLRRTWPVLSDHHGLSWLGAGMLIIGCHILGSLNRDGKHMASEFSSLVLAAGILSFVFGSLNIIGSLIWCDRKEGINSRDIRMQGSLAQSQSDYVPDYASGSHASSVRNEKTKSKFMSMFWKKESGAPDADRPAGFGGLFSRGRTNSDVEGQTDDRGSPIVPGVKRPDTALHPIHTRRSSKYSEAEISRF